MSTHSEKPSILRSPAVLAGAAAAGLALTGATGYAGVAYADTTVSVTVDGETTEDVRFFGRSVESALKAANVQAGADDRIEPSIDSRVGEGDVITVTYARDLAITQNGQTTTHRVAATTVGEAIQVLGIQLDGQRLSVPEDTPIGRDGIAVELTEPMTFTVVLAGESAEHSHSAPTVAEALAETAIEVGPDDLVAPPLDAPTNDGMTITIIRVVKEERTRTEEVPFETKKTNDATLEKGKTKVTTKGVKGEQSITELVITHDGKPHGAEVISKKVTKKPVAQEVKVGTKAAPKPAPAPGGGDSAPSVPDGSVWDKLAQCESGGNWKINTGNGYYGGLQFSASSWKAVGGTGLPHQHSRETQIAMGKKLKAKQGWGAWPACSRKLGLR